jgi:hypothetical protein
MPRRTTDGTSLGLQGNLCSTACTKSGHVLYSPVGVFSWMIANAAKIQDRTIRRSVRFSSTLKSLRRDSSLPVQYFARDNQPLDLTGTFANGAELNIAVEFLDRVVFDEAIATVKLHCLVADPDRHFTGH